jgi:hypothetical protein
MGTHRTGRLITLKPVQWCSEENGSHIAGVAPVPHDNYIGIDFNGFFIDFQKGNALTYQLFHRLSGQPFVP